MAFAQMTNLESLRDIETCLRAMRPKLYHTGIRGKVCGSTLADLNQQQDCRMFAECEQVLIAAPKPLYAGEDFGVEIKSTVYALDSTTIDLCLALFPSVRSRRTKAAVKLHRLLDLRGSIPGFIHITDGKNHDVNVLDVLIPTPEAFYVMDRGYINFERLFRIQQAGAFFATPGKRNLQCRRRYSHAVDKISGLRSDHTVLLTGPTSATSYRAPFIRVRYVDMESAKHFAFLTKNFTLSALTIARLY